MYLRCISLLTSAVEQEQIIVRPGEMGAGNAVIPKLMAWRDPLGVCYPRDDKGVEALDMCPRPQEL